MARKMNKKSHQLSFLCKGYPISIVIFVMDLRIVIRLEIPIADLCFTLG